MSSPVFRDPVYDGATDPTVVYDTTTATWWMFYTQRRTDDDGPGHRWVHGTEIGTAISRDDGVTWTYNGVADGLERGNTLWAPEVVRAAADYRMYVTVVDGVPEGWHDAEAQIVEYRSRDLQRWGRVGPLDLGSDRVIDAAVALCPDGLWRLWYKNERDGSSTWVAASADLESWTVEGRAIAATPPHEGPNVFELGGWWWLITDEWRGLGVYRSPDAVHWIRQTRNGGLILDKPGADPDDREVAHHADVVTLPRSGNSRAALFYFTHPGRTGSDRTDRAVRASAIQVARLTVHAGELFADRDVTADDPLGGCSRHPSQRGTASAPVYDAYLLAYFRSEEAEDGERLRFAVSGGPAPTDFTELRNGKPILASDVGERGVRDPFLVRDERTGRFFVLATDLRTWPDHDWNRAVRYGSRSIVIWESTDLTSWEAPRLVELAPAEAGNTWAPKAFWSEARQRWLVFWASALFSTGESREPGTYQRIMVCETDDFRSFGPARVHLDFGHDVIDLTFLNDGDQWYRFSANAHVRDGRPDIGHHIFMEHGPALEEPRFEPLTIDVGRDVMRRAEGPAAARAVDGNGWYLLADEFGLRGYQLFHTTDLAGGQWSHLPDAALPPGARHGSLLPITAEERDRLLEPR